MSANHPSAIADAPKAIDEIRSSSLAPIDENEVPDILDAIRQRIALDSANLHKYLQKEVENAGEISLLAKNPRDSSPKDDADKMPTETPPTSLRDRPISTMEKSSQHVIDGPSRSYVLEPHLSVSLSGDLSGIQQLISGLSENELPDQLPPNRGLTLDQASLDALSGVDGSLDHLADTSFTKIDIISGPDEPIFTEASGLTSLERAIAALRYDYVAFLEVLHDIHDRILINYSDKSLSDVFFDTIIYITTIYSDNINILSRHIDKFDNSIIEISARERFSLLEEFAKRYAGHHVAALGEKLFPELFDLDVTAADSVTGGASEVSVVDREVARIWATRELLQSTGVRGPQRINRKMRATISADDAPDSSDRSSEPSLLLAAPKLWNENRVAGENAPDFIRRVYASWIGRGLSRPLLKRLDPPLYLALNRWLNRPGNTMPADLDLPTRQQVNDRLIADIQQGEPVGSFSLKEAGRIASALQRRGLKRGG